MKTKSRFSQYLFIGICIMLISLTQNCIAQSVSRQSISSYGASNTSGGHSFSQTVGQPYSTKSSNAGIALQGFQQSINLKVERLEPTKTEELNVRVYPNPTKYVVNIHFQRQVEEGIAKVINMNGEKIHEQKLDSARTQINCSNWAVGIYFILVSDKSNNQSIRKLIISN